MIDHVYVVEQLDFTQERTRFTQRLVAAGGMTGTALAQAANVGCDAHAISLLGDDADGRRVRASLRGFGVKTRRLRLTADSRTTVALVFVERRTGERRFVVADRRGLERGVADFDLAPITPGAVLLVDGHFPAQALRAARRARQVGATVVGDFHRVSPANLRLLPWVDYPIVPLEFARAFGAGSPRQVVEAMAAQFGGTPVVTLGEKGGVYWTGRGVAAFPAHRVRVRDTTGAGDVFHGVFGAALACGAPLERALSVAARAASTSCTAFGGTGRLMTADEFERALTPRSRARATARSRRG